MFFARQLDNIKAIRRNNKNRNTTGREEKDARRKRCFPVCTLGSVEICNVLIPPGSATCSDINGPERFYPHWPQIEMSRPRGEQMKGHEGPKQRNAHSLPRSVLTLGIHLRAKRRNKCRYHSLEDRSCCSRRVINVNTRRYVVGYISAKNADCEGWLNTCRRIPGVSAKAYQKLSRKNSE